MKKSQIYINKPVCLGLSIIELNKILMYEFCYYYVKPKYGEETKLCDMHRDSFIVYINNSIIESPIIESPKQIYL